MPFSGEHPQVIDFILAVRVGFEPTEPVKVQRFSRPPDSTTLAPHRTGVDGLANRTLHILPLARLRTTRNNRTQWILFRSQRLPGSRATRGKWNNRAFR